jgi:four helix bundle protein
MKSGKPKIKGEMSVQEMQREKIRTFRDLIAWQKAMGLTEQVYSLTSGMPETERFGLMSQMRRAAVSIPSNIAEGYARQSRVDYVRFLKTARGSHAELQTQVILAKRLGFIRVTDEFSQLLEETDRVLQGLIRSLETKRR